MIRAYQEKLIEDFIRDFPREFLGENLTFLQQQPLICGFRPDLIFKDENNQFVIVEVQLFALDRNHFYKTLEYRDLLRDQESCEEPRIILVCNEIPSKYEKIIKTHKAKCITITKDEFITKAKQLNQNLKIRKNPHRGTRLTIYDVLKKLSAKKTDNKLPGDLDVLVLWFYDNPWSKDSPDRFKYTNVPKLPKQFELYFNECRGPYDNSPKSIDSEVSRSKPPREIIVSWDAFENFSVDKLDPIYSWLELLTRYSQFDFETMEIILGYRNYGDIYRYEDYIHNNIRRFEPIWRIYGAEVGYNVDKIRDDLNLLFNFQFYTGKFPRFESIRFCSEIKISEGPGRLIEIAQKRKELFQNWITNGMHKHFRKQFNTVEEFLEYDKKEWVTIEFIDMKSSAFRILKELIDMLWVASRHRSIRNIRGKINNISFLVPDIGIMSAKHIKDIRTDALKLSSRYFQHMKKPEKRVTT